MEFHGNDSMEYLPHLPPDDADLVINNTVTKAAGQGVNVIQVVLDTLIYSILIIVMFSMGCGVSLTELKKHLKKPIGIAIGMGCQFLLMPFAAFCVIKLFGIDGLHATGVLLTSSCPGGTVSNVFTYFSDGDISLSVAMTTLSGIMALAAMPANIWLYGLVVETGEAKVPFLMIMLSLLITIPPAFAGYLFKYKWPQKAPLATKYGSIIGMITILATIGLSLYDKPEIYLSASGPLYGAVFLLPPMGIIASYLISWAFRRPSHVRRTIAIEAGIQNVGLALTVASLSFKPEIVRPVMLYPGLYAITMILTGTIICLAHQAHKRFSSKTTEKTETTTEKPELKVETKT